MPMVGRSCEDDVNVLALSLRLLSEPLATEIIDAWLDTAYEGTEDESLARLREAEGVVSRAKTTRG